MYCMGAVSPLQRLPVQLPPVVLCCVSSPLSLPLFLSALQLSYQIKLKKAKKHNFKWSKPRWGFGICVSLPFLTGWMDNRARMWLCKDMIAILYCYIYLMCVVGFVNRVQRCRADEKTSVFMWLLREKGREEERSLVCLCLLAQMNHRLKCDSTLRFQLNTTMGLRIAQ